MDTSREIVQQQTKMSLMAKGILMHVVIVSSFTLIYTIYTYNIHDDYGLKRDAAFDTLINAMFLSSFVAAGSVPPNLDHQSSLSRLILIFNVLLSSLAKVWLISSD